MPMMVNICRNLKWARLVNKLFTLISAPNAAAGPSADFWKFRGDVVANNTIMLRLWKMKHHILEMTRLKLNKS